MVITGEHVRNSFSGMMRLIEVDSRQNVEELEVTMSRHLL